MKQNESKLMALLLCLGITAASPTFLYASKVANPNIAQQGNIVKGVITDANGEPIIGATVKAKGSSTGTVTDLDGNFSLQVASGTVLEISYIGYKNQTVTAGTSPLKIQMQEDSKNLNEVVVVGFGTQKKVNLTGSVGIATAKDLESRPVTSATMALQGLVPGLQISTNTGELDKTADINVRGQGTIGDGSSGH